MKNKVIIYWVGLMFLLSSCQEAFFEEEHDLGKLATNEDIRIVLNGAWEQLNSQYYWDMYIRMISRGDDFIYYYYFNGVSITNAQSHFLDENDPFTDPWYGNHTFRSSNPIDYQSNPVYVASYRALASLNKVITAYEGEEIPRAAGHLIGEAYLARGYIYFVLTRFFAEIPLVTDIDVDYTVKRSSMTEVFNQIVSDLENASMLLPDTPVAGRTGRNTLCTGTAKAVLAEVYLAMGGYPLHDEAKYALAAEIAGEVIANKDLYGYSLLPDYPDLLNYDLNEESVFTITLDRFGIEGFGYYDGFFPEWRYYNEFPRDHRKQACMKTFIEYNVYYPREDSRIYKIFMDVYRVPLEDGPNFIYHYDMAYKKNPVNKYWENRDLQNPTLSLIRYAHTLLTYAESKARSGSLDASAYEALNQVRRRANNKPVDQPSDYDLPENLTPAQFADSVVNERKWEFCAEPVGRWFDVLRLDLLPQIQEQRHEREIKIPGVEEYYPEGGYFTFIPEEDLLVNPALAPDTIN